MMRPTSACTTARCSVPRGLDSTTAVSSLSCIFLLPSNATRSSTGASVKCTTSRSPARSIVTLSNRPVASSAFSAASRAASSNRPSGAARKYEPTVAAPNRAFTEVSHSRFKCRLRVRAEKCSRSDRRLREPREHHMRYAALVISMFLLIHPADAATTPEIDPRASLSVVQQWIYNYRGKPDYARVPAAVRVLFHAQSFKEPENSGIYLGFIAGAIGSNPAKAEQLVNSIFPVPPEDEWVIVRAVAYSGLPDWRNLLRRVAPKMPGRRVMIDSYLAGTLPTLTA